MGLFTNRVTQVLGNVFRFRDGRSNISSVDLSGPIQPVFDLSRGAGLGRAADFGTTLGLVGIELNMVHAGAGDLHNEVTDIYGAEAAFFRVPEDELWIWIMDIAGYTTAGGNTSAAQASVRDASIQGTINVPGEGRLLWTAPDNTGQLFEAGGGRVALTDATSPSNRVNFPYLITPGAEIQVSSGASGAATVSIIFRIWVGPRYTMPPGL